MTCAAVDGYLSRFHPRSVYRNSLVITMKRISKQVNIHGVRIAGVVKTLRERWCLGVFATSSSSFSDVKINLAKNFSCNALDNHSM